MSDPRKPIAIIGMSGRFPGALTLDKYWDNLKHGVESVERIPEEIIEAHRDPRGEMAPHFVPMGTYLEQTELFDHHFFGLSLRDAKLMDPQQRLFIEHAWTAIEDAGYDVAKLGRVGVYAGGGPSRHVLDALDAFGHDGGTLFEVVATGSANAMAMRVSYLFNLVGESIYIYTACSTTLVAVDMACRALLSGRVDVALAGGTALWLPQREGYEYVPGMILSRDGHCRPFDAQASGTVWSNGVSVIVLKTLEAALRDGDPIRAVIVGSSTNNDGRLHKLSFAAPSAEGQADAIRQAYDEAGISASSVSFVEAHGTGTPVGDPLEVEGLHLAFGKGAGPRTCALGSVKGNIGHLDPVAGLASLTKVVLALENKQIPPSLHFETPNPAIDFAAGPFFVNQELVPWEPAQGPRRAGINSFGVGGTNAHVVVEEAPARAPSDRSARPRQLVTLSARTERALSTLAKELAAHLDAHPELALEDVAYTRNVGRRPFEVRASVVAPDMAALKRALTGPLQSYRKPVTAHAKVAFLFPGQAAQHLFAARELYETEASYRQDVDDCAEVLSELLDLDVRQVLYPTPEQQSWAESSIMRTELAQPVLFVLEYSLARLWMRFGIKPAAMLGHSVGEYVAAALAGVFDPGDALALLVERGKLMQSTPAGAMLAVALAEQELLPLLGADVEIATINSPKQCVVSGTPQGIAELERELKDRGFASSRLRASHAFHSRLLDGIVAQFESAVASVPRNAPELPFVSNVTGQFITAEQAESPAYWARHLREAVRFADGMDTLRNAGLQLFLEVGPGQTLTNLFRDFPGGTGEVALASLRHASSKASDYTTLLDTLGKLWMRCAPVNWDAFYAEERRARLSLPHYPFQKEWCALYAPGEEFHLIRKALGAQRLSNPGASDAPVRRDTHRESTARADEPTGGGETLRSRPESYHRPFVAPATETQARIAELFGRALGIDGLGADDDFVEFGAQSLMLVALTNHLRAMFDVQVSVRAVIENPTAIKLEALIQSLTTKASQP